MPDLVWCELCEDYYLLGQTGEHMWDEHRDIMEAREAREKRDPDTDMPWNPEPDPWGKS